MPANTASPDPVKADAFAVETRAELALAAPDFDLKGLAERGRRLSLLTHDEAEDLALRARFPDWLANRIRTAADEPEMPGDVFQLLEPHLLSLMPASGDYSSDSVLSGFRPIHAASPHISQTAEAGAECQPTEQLAGSRVPDRPAWQVEVAA